VISDEFTPDTAANALLMGADTVITPSDIYEEVGDAQAALALAGEFYDRLLAN